MKLTIVFLALLVLFARATMTDQQLTQNITKTLDSHLVEGTKWNMSFHFYRPGLVKYGPYQWLWDSCFHMITWSHLNVNNSILDLNSMLQMQKMNGEVPEMIFWGHQSTKDKVLNWLMNSDPKTTDISQMPMLAFALKRIYEETKNLTLLKQVLPKVAEYYGWWANERQPDHDGLIVIIHPWESGLDASPMYDQALGVKNPKPKLLELYPKFEQLILSYRFNYNWNQKRIVKPKHKNNHLLTEYFVVKEVGVNSVYAASWRILADLAAEYNQPMADYCRQQYQWFSRGVMSLYDQQKGRFVSKYLKKDKYQPTAADTVQSLFPILLDIPVQMRTSILRSLQDPKKYNTKYAIPTVALDDPAYNPVFTIDLMWRGPTWAAPNYFVLEGLWYHGLKDLYKEIGQKWVNQAKQFGVWEMWNPENGTGYGVPGLGMSTSVVDVMARLKNL